MMKIANHPFMLEDEEETQILGQVALLKILKV
jgi:hypothetical protein